jgi:hypothetical protein
MEFAADLGRQHFYPRISRLPASLLGGPVRLWRRYTRIWRNRGKEIEEKKQRLTTVTRFSFPVTGE